jgi:hypothetical protein
VGAERGAKACLKLEEMVLSDTDRVRELTTRALDEFEANSSTSALVRQAHRIAALRHDYAQQVWCAF